MSFAASLAAVPSAYGEAVTRFGAAAFEALRNFEREERERGLIFPPAPQVFAALEFFRPEETRVLILGQDPYHDDGQAQGLSFSVPDMMKTPPSLRNIFKELAADSGRLVQRGNDLSDWARQGVLLLNTVLTVRAHCAGSHQKQGWEEFTAHVVDLVNERAAHAVFILWGAPAQKVKNRIDLTRHEVIESAHPSPLSAYRGFFGSRPFSRSNEFLAKHGLREIDWMGAPVHDELF